MRALARLAAAVTAGAALGGCIDLSRPTGERPCAVTRTCDEGYFCDRDAICRVLMGPESCTSQFNFENGNLYGFQGVMGSRTALTAVTNVERPTTCGSGALKITASYAPDPAQARAGEVRKMMPTNMTLSLAGKLLEADIRLEGPAFDPGNGFVARLYVGPDQGNQVTNAGQVITGVNQWVHLTYDVTYAGNVAYMGVILDAGAAPITWSGSVFLDEIRW